MHDGQDEILLEGYKNTEPKRVRKNHSPFGVLGSLVKNMAIPAVIGAVLAVFLTMYVPKFFELSIAGNIKSAAADMAYYEVDRRIGALVNGDFSNPKSWGYPLFGALIAVYLRFLYKAE